MNIFRVVALAAIYVVSTAGPVHPPQQQETSQTAQKVRFGPEIEAFLHEDTVIPPPKGAILFVGSSIFRQWTNLKRDMAPLPVFNRAFGGSRTSEVLYYMDKIVLPHKPRIVVYYCGSNDVNAGATAPEIFLHFKQFSDRVAQELPATVVFYVSINRAPQKMDKWGVVDSANALIRNFCRSTKKREFIDVNPVLFDRNGKPRMELYRDDKLHFKGPAYEEFTRIIKPALQKAWEQN